MARALYPGSFDPLTRGHLDVAARAVGLFGHVTLGIAENIEKSCHFSVEERMEMAREAAADLDADVICIGGLVVEACRAGGFDVIVRGIRNGTDFDDEVAMALTNRALEPDVETVFLVPDADRAHVSSRLVKEIASGGGDCSRWVTPGVAERLSARFGGRA
jgi:pantetheine-phosphate adenylyltransferase